MSKQSTNNNTNKRPASSIYIISSDDDNASSDDDAIQLISYNKKSKKPSSSSSSSLPSNNTTTKKPSSSSSSSQPSSSKPSSSSSSNQHQQSNYLKYDGSTIYFNKLPNDDDNTTSSTTTTTNTNNNFITLKEILNIQQATSLFLSSYCVDFNFLKTQIPQLNQQQQAFSSTTTDQHHNKKPLTITLSKHWDQKEERKGKQILQIGQCPLCICHPSLLGIYSNMHAKLFIIEFTNKEHPNMEFIRIVISSANLTEFDWNYYKQCIWIQDFPKKKSLTINSNSKNGNTINSNEFENTLVDFFSSLTDGLPGNYLRQYDYSNAKGQLIPSIPGYHQQQTKNNNNNTKYGHLAIKKSIENITKNTKYSKNDILYYQMSSIGSLNIDYIKELSQSFKLNNYNNFNIVYPSLDIVSNSHYGLKCGGMIHLKSKNFESLKFPSHLLTHYLPNHGQHLSHSKILLLLLNQQDNKDKQHDKQKDDDNLVLNNSDSDCVGSVGGYVMVGSHNLSQAALGKLQKNGSQLYIMNYELGILLKIDKSNRIGDSDGNRVATVDVNNENLKRCYGLNLPFKIPCKRMDLKRGDSPFILETVQDLLD